MEVEVDASVTAAAVEDLSQKMKATAASDDTLFDPSFEAGAHIQNVISPLKYQVCDRLQNQTLEIRKLNLFQYEGRLPLLKRPARLSPVPADPVFSFYVCCCAIVSLSMFF